MESGVFETLQRRFQRGRVALNYRTILAIVYFGSAALFTVAAIAALSAS